MLNQRKHQITLIYLFISAIVSGCGSKKDLVSKNYFQYSAPEDYHKKNKILRERLNAIRYDSAKIYYFNQEKYETGRFSLSVDTPQVYNVRLVSDDRTYYKGSATTDKGRLIAGADSKKLIKILRIAYKDKFRDEEVSPFIPTTGVVFFAHGVPVAHIDIAPVGNKVEVEIFGKDGKVYRFFWELIGTRTAKFLASLSTKYQLPNWVRTLPY